MRPLGCATQGMPRGTTDLSVVWFIAFAGAMKYGFWMVFVMLVYSGLYTSPGGGLAFMAILGLHVLLIFETMLLVGKIRVKDSFLIIGTIWFLVNDLADYLLGTHLPLPESALGFMFPATVGMTLVFTMMSYVILNRWSREFSGQ